MLWTSIRPSIYTIMICLSRHFIYSKNFSQICCHNYIKICSKSIKKLSAYMRNFFVYYAICKCMIIIFSAENIRTCRFFKFFSIMRKCIFVKHSTFMLSFRCICAIFQFLAYNVEKLKYAEKYDHYKPMSIQSLLWLCAKPYTTNLNCLVRFVTIVGSVKCMLS